MTATAPQLSLFADSPDVDSVMAAVRHTDQPRGEKDAWWPSHGDLAREAMEVEAEAVAHIVSR